jgi:putative endonuclease
VWVGVLMKQYYVYIMTNASGTLYVGVTSNLEARSWQHRAGAVPGFTKRYRISRVLYFETTNDAVVAIEREKQLKGWTRKKKLDLVKKMNPGLEDLSRSWFKAKT